MCLCYMGLCRYVCVRAVSHCALTSSKTGLDWLGSHVILSIAQRVFAGNLSLPEGTVQTLHTAAASTMDSITFVFIIHQSVKNLAYQVIIESIKWPSQGTSMHKMIHSNCCSAQQSKSSTYPITMTQNEEKTKSLNGMFGIFAYK